ncbi:hypothetical protein [Aeromonas allosaccharophila]|uniref:hypothetical protein n=1 Tax=Aeromonas allosaccharophila TaxID=656 RepID=UPI003D1DA060
MKPIEEQAQLLDLEYQGIALLFDQFCQRAGTLAKQYKFFNWPDYEDTPPLCRAFTLLGETRELRLSCQPGERGELNGIIQIVDEAGQVQASQVYRADGRLPQKTGRFLDNPPELLLKLMLDAVWQPGLAEGQQLIANECH